VKILFCRQQLSAELSWPALAGVLPGWELTACDPGEVAAQLDGVDVVCPFGGAKISREVIEAGSFGLIHQFGVGLEGVDLAAATEAGVWVSRVDGSESGNADSVAELAVLLILALARRLDEQRDVLREQRWGERPAGRSLQDATVAVVGLGAIGQAVTQRLAPFGPRLLGVRARPERGGPPEVAEVRGAADLREVLSQADVVVCCAMLHAGNDKLFGAAEFAAMRPGTLFVNVARGGLVDEDALTAALSTGQVGGAGLDVHRREPPDPGSALLTHPGVIATPHVGWLTTRMFRQTSAAFGASVRRWAEGGEPLWPANAPAFRRTAARRAP
jgi:phosphoglycerate dehydrogenase-like enzyme